VVFLVFTAGVAVNGSILLGLAVLSGPHEKFGVVLYAGDAIGTTGLYALIGQRAPLRPMRMTATIIAVVVGLLWLLGVPSFVESTGWDF
jgi:hypothetical protein